MKLRIKGNSLRMRLTTEEIDALGKYHTVEAYITFPSGKLAYEIKGYSKKYVTADFMSDKITVYIPQSKIKEWVDTDLVSISGEVNTTEGATSILLEKDFQCLMPRVGEDESTLYPNPLAKTDDKR